MPHVIVEYSANLEPHFDVAGLIDGLHETALSTGLFDIDGIRSRAVRRDAYRVADGSPDNAFLQITARIGEGRSAEDRRRLGEALLAAAELALAAILDSKPVALTVEVHEIDRAMTFRRNTIRERRRHAAAK